MKFCTTVKKEVEISIDIEDDGCAIINANGIGIIRFTNKGYVAFISNVNGEVKKLKDMGFTMNGNSVSQNH